MSGSSRWLLGGGIGSGKSSVRRLLAESGIHTVDSDSIGHSVLEPDGPAFSDVASRWPGVVHGGVIDRSALASIVFSDPAQLGELEALTHPHILAKIGESVDDVDGVVVVELPLLRKAPPGEWRRLVVDCEDSVRLQRLLARGMSIEDARARMSAQPSRSEWLAVADIVMPNHSRLTDLERAVDELLGVIGPSPLED